MSVPLRNKSDNTKQEPRPKSATAPPKVDVKVARATSMLSAKRAPIARRVESFGASAVEELVQCGICTEQLNQPKMLTCQHTFCLSCLQSYLTSKITQKGKSTEDLKSTSITFKCPTCRTQIIINDGIDGLEKLESNVYIDSLLNVLKGGSTSSSNLKTSKLDNRCVTCQTVCLYTDETCKHCKLNFCQVCWPQHANEIEIKMASFLPQLSESENRINYKHQDFQSQCEQLKEEVDDGTEERIKSIRTMQEGILKEIETLSNDGTRTMNEFKEKIKILEENIKQNSKSQTTDSSEKVLTYMKFHNEVSKLLEEISLYGETRKVFDVDNFKLTEDGGITMYNEDEIDGYIPSQRSQDALISQYKHRTFNSKLIWSKCPRSAGVAIPQWAPELVYIAATENKNVLILNTNKNKIVGKLSHPNMLCPFSIDFCPSTQEIFISDKWKHCIHVFSNDGEYLRHLCGRGSGDGQLLSPQGLAINTSGQIVICDTGNNRVLVLDSTSGTQITTIGVQDRKTELRTPTDIKIFGENIYVADSGNYRIKIFNKVGEKIKEFGAMGRNKGQFYCAEVLAVDKNGFILVGDAGNARLQIFDANCNLIRSFGGTSGQKKFKWISGIHVTPDFEIIITDGKNKSLYIF